VLAAVTGDDEDNLVAAQVAKKRFNVPRTVARINNPRNEFIFSELGIDATVSATQVILSIIQQEIPQHPFVHLLTLREGGIEFVELALTDDSPAIGRTMGEVDLPEDTAVPLLLRAGKPIVVRPDTQLESGDRLIAVTTSDMEASLRRRVLGSQSLAQTI
jgi:trk system potassium uptake protein TrkA